QLLGGADVELEAGASPARGVAAPEEDARPLPRGRPRVEPRVGERARGGLERGGLVPLPPPRPHPHGAARRRLPARPPADPPAAPAVEPVGRARPRVVERRVPPAGRHVADGIDPVADVPPERLEVRRAREQARHADDRDAVHLPRLRAYGAPPQVPDRRVASALSSGGAASRRAPAGPESSPRAPHSTEPMVTEE